LSLFVTGSDTGVGKTIVCAVMLTRFGRGLELGYWKPIATGAVSDSDCRTVNRLSGAYGTIHGELYRYHPPVSPHLAARWKRETISVPSIRDSMRKLQIGHPGTEFIVEGIGGALVPLTDDGVLLVDAIRLLRLSCLVVTRSSLGTINHTLMTLEALRRRRLEIAGVVMNGPRNRHNRDAIERFGDVPVVAELEPMGRVTRRSVVTAARRFDRAAVLKRFLTRRR